MEHALAGKATLLYAQGSNIWRNKGTAEKRRIRQTNQLGQQAGDEGLKALKIAKEADVIVCAMGESAEMSGECGSRTNLEMPDVQRELLRRTPEDRQACGAPQLLQVVPRFLLGRKPMYQPSWMYGFGGSRDGRCTLRCHLWATNRHRVKLTTSDA